MSVDFKITNQRFYLKLEISKKGNQKHEVKWIGSKGICNIFAIVWVCVGTAARGWVTGSFVTIISSAVAEITSKLKMIELELDQRIKAHLLQE